LRKSPTLQFQPFNTLWLSIAIFATVSVSEAAPARGLCDWLFSGLSKQTVEKTNEAAPFDLSAKKEAFRKALENHQTSTSTVTQPEEKVALLSVAIENIVGESLRPAIGNDKFVAAVIRDAGLGTDALTSLEATRATIQILKFYDPNARPRGWISRFITGEIIPDLSQKASQIIFSKDNRFQNELEALAESGYVESPTTIESIKSSLGSMAPVVRVAKSIFVNSVLVYIGLVPMHFPDVRVSEFVGANQEISDVIASGAAKEVFELVRTRMSVWSRIDIGVRSVRMVYMRSLAVALAILVTVNHDAVYGLAKNLYISASPTYMQNYESKTYDPVQVVNDELAKWQLALEHPPSDAEVRAKRAELEAQERAGIFRIYRVR